jgi:hypothetical protein
MKLLQPWFRRRARPDCTADAISLFTRISRRHGLTHVTSDAPVEVMWEFPVQEKLVWPITLSLQNFDELNFGVPGFWSYFFPFSSVAEEFERYIDAWVLNQARVVRNRSRVFRISSSVLEILSDGKWRPVYRANGNAWPHPKMIIQNSRN